MRSTCGGDYVLIISICWISEVRMGTVFGRWILYVASWLKTSDVLSLGVIGVWTRIALPEMLVGFSRCSEHSLLFMNNGPASIIPSVCPVTYNILRTQKSHLSPSIVGCIFKTACFTTIPSITEQQPRVLMKHIHEINARDPNSPRRKLTIQMPQITIETFPSASTLEGVLSTNRLSRCVLK